MNNIKTVFWCCGIQCDNFPWKDKNPEDWWLKDICKWVPPFEIFDGNGNLIEGISDQSIKKYYIEKIKFENEHPIPFKVVNHGKTVLAIPSSIVIAYDSFLKNDYYFFDHEQFELELPRFSRFIKRFNLDKDPIRWFAKIVWEDQ